MGQSRESQDEAWELQGTREPPEDEDETGRAFYTCVPIPESEVSNTQALKLNLEPLSPKP